MNPILETADFEIHQTVHGYDDGHRLLAASSRLPKDVERLLLLLSDVSGPGGGDPFDPYLTGYPIESLGCYALARTWPASEMDRPGCVWTHTLLIGNELLDHLDHPELLLSLFHRPTVDLGFSDYLEAIPWPSKMEANQQTHHEYSVDASLAVALVRALYGSLSPHSVLTVPRYSLAAGPLLAIWRLQWPQLRRQFTFCSGCRAPRSLSGELFHLQAVLDRDLRRFVRSRVSPSVVPWQMTSSPEPEEWMRLAAAACIDDENSSLLAFLGQVGRALPADSTLFRPVVQAHLILSHSAGTNAIAKLIGYIADEFPEPEMAREYKQAFFKAGNPAGLSEPLVLRGLTTAERSRAFDSVDLEIRSRSASLWDSSDEAWDLLTQILNTPQTLLVEEAVVGLCSSMPLRFLRPALDASPEVFAGILSHNPALACTAELWTVPLDYQSRAVASLLICRDSVDSLADIIIQTALEAGADPANPSLVDLFGPRAVTIVLDWLETDPERINQLPAGWRSALSDHSIQMIEWLDSRSRVRPETTNFVLTILNLESALSHSRVVAAIAKHVPREGEVAETILMPLAVRVLRTAFAMSTPEAVELAATSLDTVYHATASSKLCEESWHELSPFLPDRNWFRDWDRCQRLRTGIAEKFRLEEWPARWLPDVTRDDDLFEAIVSELRDRWSGRRVLTAIAESNTSGHRRDLMNEE